MSDVDQGLLDYLNLVTPRCSVNQEYARAMKTTGFIKSVPIGQQCPSGYRAYQPTAEGLPANTINQICIINTPNEAQNAAAFPLAMRWSECVSRRPSAPASVPAPVLAPAPAPATKSELPIWAIVLIVIAAFMLVCGLIFMGIKMSQ
jgi:hypothetical protein